MIFFKFQQKKPLFLPQAGRHQEHPIAYDALDMLLVHIDRTYQ